MKPDNRESHDIWTRAYRHPPPNIYSPWIINYYDQGFEWGLKLQKIVHCQEALWAQDCLIVRLFILILKSFPFKTFQEMKNIGES